MGRYIINTWKITLVLGVLLAVCSSVWALPPNPYDTFLTSTTGGYVDEVIAQVTQSGSLFHYSYEVKFLDSFVVNQSTGQKAPLTTFSVGNMQNFEFTNAGNSGGIPNPIYNVTSANSVLWKNGNVPVGQIVTFWYDSKYLYEDVSATLQGGRVATGRTLGMTGIIPEPASFVALALGMVGTAGMFLKKFKGR
ncbi:MAG: hypothetical protein M1133_06275 [Armatimonadetes bacterium]|nr:hypothetical protein [Armatimonadota bacterium]